MMKMQNYSKLVVLVLLLISSFGYAGGMEGGGGNSVVCRNAQGRMISAELYDLFEGRSLYGYLPKLSTEDFRTQTRKMAEKLYKATGHEFFIDETERVLKEFRLLHPDAQLMPIDDNHSIIKPTNCDIFQTAVYRPNKRVYFDSNIWALLNESNRAALVSHEVIYAFMRSSDKAQNSVRARQYVAFLYSGQEFTDKWSPGEESYEVCQTNRQDPHNTPDTPFTAFYTALNPDGSWKILFRYFDGMVVLGKMEINSRAPRNYEWPIASHDIAEGEPGGGGVGLDETLEVDIDEDWRVSDWYLDQDSNSNYLNIQTSGKWKTIYFSCQRFN